MGEVEQRFDHNVTLAKQQASHAASVRKLKKSSTQALAEIMARQEAPFDLIYVDGSHRAPDVLADAVLAFQLLRVGGIMIFDDYLWRLEPDGRQDPLNMPKPAIDSFINIFQRKLRVMSGLLRGTVQWASIYVMNFLLKFRGKVARRYPVVGAPGLSY
jgi:predicted O-methyltransferase YrrM